MNRKKFYAELLVIMLIGLLLGACGRIQRDQSLNGTEITVEMTVDPPAPSVGPARLVFVVTDAQGQPVDDAQIEVEGNMTHAGMVPVFAQSKAGDDGRYVVPFDWTMGGDWFVVVDITLADGERLSRQFPVTVENVSP